MNDHYMFIDGAYLDDCFSDFRKKWCDGAPVKLDYGRLGYGHKKVFYYDALPLQRKEEAADAFKARHDAKLAFFDELRALDGWHVHLGISKRYVGEKAQQKEVDVLLTVDMLSHTYRKNMSLVTFLAGDQDFRPLIDAVVRDGMYVRLMYDRKHTSVDLVNMADARCELDYFGYALMLDGPSAALHRAPGRSNDHGMHHPPNGILKETGYRSGQIVARLWTDATHGGDMIVGAVVVNTHYFPRFELPAGNREFLKRVFDEYHGPVEWKVNE